MFPVRRTRRNLTPIYVALALVAVAGLWATFARPTEADNLTADGGSRRSSRPDAVSPAPATPAGSPPAVSSAPPPGGKPTAAPANPAPANSAPDDPAENPAKAGAASEAPVPADQGLWVDVDLSQQRVMVKQGEQVVKEMVTSSGAPGYDTPQGTFQVQNRGEWFYSDKYEEGAKWWVSFSGWGQYLFHSIVMDKDQRVIEAEVAKLGWPASHGCLRLAVDDAKWIYDNVPQGAKVVIHA
ncbi:MAG: L,D-transpeptidase [Chitinophagales bacterium]